MTRIRNTAGKVVKPGGVNSVYIFTDSLIMAGMEVLMRLQARATAAEKLVTLLRQQIRESKVSRALNSFIFKF
jgi:hypothetical protein